MHINEQSLRDDNKILTLASNERIALTPDMRLIFEISNLRTATPATVSRAGILYLNPGDLGWNPYVTSWVETRESQAEKASLTILGGYSTWSFLTLGLVKYCAPPPTEGRKKQIST